MKAQNSEREDRKHGAGQPLLHRARVPDPDLLPVDGPGPVLQAAVGLRRPAGGPGLQGAQQQWAQGKGNSHKVSLCNTD